MYAPAQEQVRQTDGKAKRIDSLQSTHINNKEVMKK